MPERLCEPVSAPVRSRTRQALSTRREDDSSGLEIAFGCDDPELRSPLFDRLYAKRVAKFDAGVYGGREECFEDRLRRVRRREEFSVLLGLQFDVEFGEKADRIIRAEPPEDLADRVAGTTGKIVGGDAFVGHIAPAAAGNEDFCAELAGAVHCDDFETRGGSCGGDGGHQPGRSRADDYDVRRFVHSGDRR
jgi:hypothetical protein